MCGIAGYVSTSRVDSVRLENMTAALHHRGPDDGGAWHDGHVALGHRRLAIVDLSAAGHQPMRSASGDWVIVYNGEIYNAQDILQALAIQTRGHSDTEVLIEAIEKWGVVEATKRMIGMFAFAAYHRPSQQLYLCRDRLGIKPLYWGKVKGELVFTSELHSLKAWCKDLDINQDAIASFLRYGYVPAPASIYRQISKLEPGTVVTIDCRDGRSEVKGKTTYWCLQDVAAQPLLDHSDEDLLDMVAATAQQAVKDRLVADVPIGAFLSGGFDSSLVCALMQEQAGQRIKTFTIGFENPAFNEAQHAKSVADCLGTEHTELYLSEQNVLDSVAKLPDMLDEPFADSSLLPTYLVSKLAREQVTVTLSGDGGDELFWGYARYPTAQNMWPKVNRLPAPLRSLVRNIGFNSTLQRATQRVPAPAWGGRKAPLSQKLNSAAELLGAADEFEFYHGMMSQFKNPEALLIHGQSLTTAYNDPTHWSRQYGALARMAWQDAAVYLPDDILTKVDRASMAVSLEARVPLLDHRLVELAARLPAHLKQRDGVWKYALRNILNRYVPKEITDRPKMGFGVPLHEWLRGPLKDWAGDLLNPGRLREQNMFRPDMVSQLFDDHLHSSANNASKLWNILMVQLWLEQQA